MDEFETFYDEIKEKKAGEGISVFRLTIPKKLVDFAGLKSGDKVKVMIKKVGSKEDVKDVAGTITE